ncbi:TetR family transcriptional regulator [Longispora albida]|uniref:TetR family transcriptional regulator n=1 Tax=Longispora albida TaxID=203523 RepID=UPI00036D66EE|nr:TetR family transcriptional regulator [Longispora albida]
MRSLADRKRQLVRDELSEAALKLLAYQGFEETTIEQIAAAAGVSKRTFFRYFAAKEDVLIEMLSELADAIRAGLATRPASESPAEALRAVFQIPIDEFTTGHPDPAKSLRLARLVLGTPAVRARYLDRQHQLRTEVAGLLAARTGEPYRASVQAAIGFAAYEAAVERWAAADGAEDLGELVDQAFAQASLALA